MCWSDKAIIVFLNSAFKLLTFVLYAKIIINNGAQTWRICVCSNQPYPGIFNLFLTEKSMKADTGNKLNIKMFNNKNIRRMLKSLSCYFKKIFLRPSMGRPLKNTRPQSQAAVHTTVGRPPG